MPQTEPQTEPNPIVARQEATIAPDVRAILTRFENGNHILTFSTLGTQWQVHLSTDGLATFGELQARVRMS